MKMKKLRRIILILLLIIVLTPAVVTLSRYVVTSIKNLIMQANNFYFSSDKLTEDGATYNVFNWTGIDTFSIQFELNNKKNNLLYSTSDIAYELSLDCDEDVTCSLDSTSGTIYSEEKTDDFTISVTPKRAFDDNETVSVTVNAKSLSPYVKKLSATFNITVGKRGVSYEIDDTANDPTASLIITNAQTGYTVKEAFDSYAVGDEISSDTYQSLSSDKQAKCVSTTITIKFDPSVVLIDTTSEIINSSTLSYKTINGVDYVSGLVFDMDATSSIKIRFYKVDVTKDYSYDGLDTQTSIIDFNAKTVG